ncbi:MULTISPECIES: DUF47 domain-containing protein [Olsenella]|uniref:DUF47 domain-containing protein n=1 Tax=Olsenella TaxID=133925 RepID=UPI00071CCBA6|nr:MULTISPECIES: DUF47 family protein [Olsenella]OFK23547.1 phosphate transport regulator [Olsenella sp. HMSC062G07]
MARIKKEDPFYALFREFSQEILNASEDYVRLVGGYPETISMIPTMKLHETRSDAHVRKIMKELYTSFITPFDRDDISDLALKMDDIVDYMESACTGLDLFNMSTTRVEAHQMAELTHQAIVELDVMFNHLANYKRDPLVREKAIAVGEIEDQGDAVYEQGMRHLFHDDSLDEARRGHVVGWLRVFDRMEASLDACDAAAGVVRSIIMKSA